MITIGILSILATFTIYSFTSAPKKARDAARKSDLAQVKRALETAKQDCQGSAWYPVMAGANEIARYQALQNHLADADLKYMSNVPNDPQNTNLYGYNTGTASTLVCLNTATPPTKNQDGASDYMLRALLERGSSDADSTASFTKCAGKPGMPGTAGGYYYVCNE